jgi:hypothetical protein
MKKACNNNNIGYSQSDRYGVNKYGISTKTKTNCDCSSLVRQCVKEASGKDPGDFSTYDEADKLEATDLFEKRIAYISQAKTPVYNGDVLVTKTKGHTIIVVSGNPRGAALSYIHDKIDYTPVFNPTYYANKYADLKNAFGTDATKLFNHFITYGMKEKRQASENFNVIIYKDGIKCRTKSISNIRRHNYDNKRVR